MSARKPRRSVVKAPSIEVRAELGAPSIVLSRRAGRFEVREKVRPGVEPSDLEIALNGLTRTGPTERRLARLDLYLRNLASGAVTDEAFYGVGIFLDVVCYPWSDFCDVDAVGRPIALKPAMLAQVTACVVAFRLARPGRHARGKQAPLTRAEHFRNLAVKVGLIGSRADAESVRRMVRAGKRALAVLE